MIYVIYRGDIYMDEANLIEVKAIIDEQTLAEIQELMLPTVVHIENDKLDTFGSGFIIEINDEFVTIATNEHVIHSDMIADVSFFDATSCTRY